MFNWDDWYLKTVAVHQGFKNFTVFFLYIVCGSISHQFVWNFSFLLEELLLKKSQVDLKGCLWGSFVSSFKFCPSPLFQQWWGGWVFPVSWPWAGAGVPGGSQPVWEQLWAPSLSCHGHGQQNSTLAIPLHGCRRFIFQHHSCSHPREVSHCAESFTSSLYRSCLSDGTINIVFNYTALQYSAILQFLCVVLENKLNCRLFKTAFLRFQ